MVNNKTTKYFLFLLQSILQQYVINIHIIIHVSLCVQNNIFSDARISIYIRLNTHSYAYS